MLACRAVGQNTCTIAYVIAYGFINNNECILPKTVCFVTVHWCQSWGAQSAWCPTPTPSLGGGLCPPASPVSAAYAWFSRRCSGFRADSVKTCFDAVWRFSRKNCLWFRSGKCLAGVHLRTNECRLWKQLTAAAASVVK